jgi:hypothetical protein
LQVVFLLLFLGMFRYFLLFLFCITASCVFGQDVLKGKVYEIKTNIAIAGVQVSDITNKEVTTTDDKGHFSINAKKGDLVIFNGFTYEPDTLLVTSLSQDVYLTPRQNMLKEVKVTRDSTTKFNNYHDPMYHGQPVVYQRDADFRPVGGIAIRFNDSYSSEKKHARLEKEVQDQQTQEEINKVFSADNLAKYVPLKGDDLKGFIALYMPTPEVYKDPAFNLLVYLNDSYKKFQALPEDKRHPSAVNDLTN